MVTLTLNLLFLGWFLLFHRRSFFFQSRLADQKESRVLLYSLNRRFADILSTLPLPGMSRSRHVHIPDGHGPSSPTSNWDFSEQILVNTGYFLALVVFFAFSASERSFKFKKQVFGLNLAALVTSPFSLLAFFDHRLENGGLICFSVAFWMVFANEFELAVVFFFFGQAVFPAVAEYLLLTFFGMLLTKIFFKTRISGYPGSFHGVRPVTVWKWLLSLGIYGGLIWMAKLELTPADWTAYITEVKRMVSRSIRLLPASALVFAPYFFVCETGRFRGDTFYRHWFALTLCLVVFLERDRLWVYSLLFLGMTFNVLLFADRGGLSKKLTLLLPIFSATFYVEKPQAFLWVSLGLQFLNFVSLCLRNQLPKIQKVDSGNSDLLPATNGFIRNAVWGHRLLGTIPEWVWGVAMVVNFVVATFVVRKPALSLLPYFLYHVTEYPLKKFLKNNPKKSLHKR